MSSRMRHHSWLSAIAGLIHNNWAKLPVGGHAEPGGQQDIRPGHGAPPRPQQPGQPSRRCLTIASWFRNRLDHPASGPRRRSHLTGKETAHEHHRRRHRHPVQIPRGASAAGRPLVDVPADRHRLAHPRVDRTAVQSRLNPHGGRTAGRPRNRARSPGCRPPGQATTWS